MRLKSVTMHVVGLAAMSLLWGCSSPGYQQADKTSDGIAEFRAEIVKAKKSVDDTMKSLDQIAVTADTNPRKAFDQFSRNVSDLESTADRARKQSQEMKARGDEYFKQWEKELAEVKNEEIRTLAAQRKARLQESFSRIRQAAEPLKAQFDPWMSDLTDLQKYLGNDLTIAGVDAVKTQFSRARTGGIEVQKSMDTLIAELNTIAATITPAKK